MNQLDRYTEKQIKNWETNDKINIYDNGLQLYSFVLRAISNLDYKGKMYFGKVSKEVAEYIYSHTSIDCFGYNVTLKADHIRKIIKDHGNEKIENLRGQKAVNVADFIVIPDIIANPDSIQADEYRGKEAIKFVKRIDNSRLTIFAVKSKGSLDLYVHTMYIGKKKESSHPPTNCKSVSTGKQ